MHEKKNAGTCLAVQRLGFCASNVGYVGSIPIVDLDSTCHMVWPKDKKNFKKKEKCILKLN